MSEKSAILRIPQLDPSLSQVLHLLFELSEAQPGNWCLVGGLMVMLHGLENGRSDTRPTADGDVLVDIRARPTALREISAFLRERDLQPELAPDGIQHRFTRKIDKNELKVDVLAPDHVGPKADLTTTPPGRTVEVPGGTQALNRSERIPVEIDGRIGVIPRPDILGAILVKLEATSLPGDPARHYQDLAFLLTIVPQPKQARSALTPKERGKLRACPLNKSDHQAWRLLTDNDAYQGRAALQLLSAP